MLDDRLARAERSGDAGGAAARYREEGVDDALSGREGNLRREALDDGARRTDGPALEHLDLVVAALRVRDDGDGFFYGEFAALYFLDGSRYSVRNHYSVLDEDGLFYDSDDVAGADFVSGLRLGLKVPFARAADGGDADASQDIGALRLFLDGFERTLDSVEEFLDKPRGQLDGERLSGADDGLSRREAGSFFVNLDGRLVVLELYYFTDKAGVPDFNDVEHTGSGHAAGYYKRAGYLFNISGNGVWCGQIKSPPS